ncbi:unnamed protein product [Linum trigynum]|uniref:Uncharacterized protein n=1 Tax=Linum trigynum TaxID=586398 RepID=A0AAV2CU14_9ROSI
MIHEATEMVCKGRMDKILEICSVDVDLSFPVCILYTKSIFLQLKGILDMVGKIAREAAYLNHRDGPEPHKHWRKDLQAVGIVGWSSSSSVVAAAAT